MPKSYRIRTKLGTDQNIQVNLEQDFDFLEILSLKLRQEDVYADFCADYGVVVGRIVANSGFGIPNATVSIFVPVDEMDLNDPVIAALYPYSRPEDKNEDGYRYNLLPYEPQYKGHIPTGTFPTREDVLTRSEVLEIYEKYYKYTVKTNESGDFMIVGVPLGIQTIVMDLDLSNMGCFSLRPQDLIRMGMGTQNQFDGVQFRSSENIDSLPQIISQRKTVDVASFWGQPEACTIGISRVDFDLRELGIEIEPTAVFMGSIFSSNDSQMMKKNCKPKTEQGDLCGLVTGPGEIIAVRQTVGIDENNDPVLEQYVLDNGGKVIDEDGTFLTDIPMNLDYVVTNEFGETVISQDPSIGIPTGGKYRFKIKYQSEENGPAINEGTLFPIQGDIIRANFLVPQIREHGWTGTATNPGVDPATKSSSTDVQVDFNNTNLQTETKTVSIGSNQVVIIRKYDGIEKKNVEASINGVVSTNKWLEFPNGGTLTLTVKKQTVTSGNPPVTTAQSGSLFLEVFDYDYIKFQKSYAMSLDWNDYADKDAAINCEDSFYSMKYNKVYTTAQLIDEYRNGNGRARFMGIKEVLERSCENDTNKFPVNDGVRNFDFIFFLFSLLLTIFTPTLYTLTIIGHVICFLWPVLRFLLRIIGTVILGIIVVLCNVVKALSFGLLKLNCPKWKVISLSEKCPLSAIPLPNMSYPDCATCECDGRDAGQAELDDDFDAPRNNTILANSTEYLFFEKIYAKDGSEFDEKWNSKYIFGFQTAMSGFDDGGNDSYTKAPFIKGGLNPFTNRETWSYDLPLTERMNLFNVKAKYHQYSDLKKSNRIRAKINPTLNNNYYQDNVMVLLVDPGTDGLLTPGQVVSFQDPQNSLDPNISGGTTGTCFNGNKTVSVDYMNPTSPNSNSSASFVITGGTGTINYQFPADIEYYQVITGQTLQEYQNINQSNQTSWANVAPDNTLGQRFIFGWQRVEKCCVSNNPDAFPDNSGSQTFETNVPSIKLNSDWGNHMVYFLVRGVDMNTPTQEIEYDLSGLYGYNSFGNVKVRGNYRMNIPVKKYASTNTSDWRIQRHLQYTNNNQSQLGYLFYPSYSNVQWNNYQSFNTKNHLYYSSLDSTQLVSNHKGNIGNGQVAPFDGGIGKYKEAVATSSNGPGDRMVDGNQNADYDFQYYDDEIVEGGTLIVAKDKDEFAYYSPTYIVGSPNHTIPMTNDSRLVMRADRLPTSDVLDRRFVLHQNNNFAFYLVGNDGGTTSLSTTYATGADDGLGAADDFAEDGGAVAQQILQTFSCEGMVPLECYSGNGETIGVLPEDDECYYVGTEDGGVKKMYGGCYYLIQRNFFFLEDFQTIAEWKARFRMMFALCRNVVSLTFVNNWVNGTLYMYSFQKDTIYNNPLSGTTFNSNPSYQYCTDTIVYQEVNNSFFYRATPYNNGFIGKPSPKRNDGSNYRGANLRNLGNPTTIMDMGPRDIFAKEICFNPDYQGYIVDKVASTSYKDTSDILQLMVISRLSDANFWEQVLGVGDGSVQKLFSRENSRLDGDVAQLLSINSEFGVVPFLGSNYNDDQIAYLNSIDANNKKQPVLGVFFSANTVNRDLISPGRQIFEDNTQVFLENTFSYNDQVIPYQPWNVKQDTNKYIFGTQLNDWNAKTSADIRTINYQTIDRLLGNPTFPSDTSSPTTQIPGYIYNSDLINNNTEVDYNTKTTANLSKLLVGAPYHFYFGLKLGKSAMNKFIDKYVITRDVL